MNTLAAHGHLLGHPPGHPPGHHPAEDVLFRHAAGTLPAGYALVVATHLRFCAACRDAVRLAEAAGGVVLEEMQGAGLSDGALDRTLALLDTPIAESTGAPPMGFQELIRFQGVALPAALRVLTASRWRWTGPGVARMVLDLPGATREERTWLVRVEPHRSMPSHGHSGWEATCVLAGGFADRTGHYGRGDVVEMDEGARHRPVAVPGEPCICLIAWDGPLTMRGLVPKLFQRLTGM